MSTHTTTDRTYTIMETARLSGLPESTLRYYESIGIIDPIRRDASSKQRVYTDGNINQVIAVACLSAMGMSIKDMRSYLDNRSKGSKAADDQVALLQTQQTRLAKEARYLELRQQYVDTKIAYWKAVQSNDESAMATMRDQAHAIAEQLHLPRQK